MSESMKDQLSSLFSTDAYKDHRVPVSRRDLLRFGLIQFGAAATAPWWARSLMANTLKFPTIPFLTFDLAGGAALPANFLVGMKGGPLDLCTNYRALGWNPRASDSMDTAFGLPMAKGKSKILEGMRATMAPEMFLADGSSLVQMSSFLHFSLDDTSTNPSSALPLIARSGLKGSKSKAGLGMRSSLTGGNSRGLDENPATKPKAISSVDDILKLTSVGTYIDTMDEGRRRSVLKILADQGIEKAQSMGLGSQTLIDSFQNLTTLGVPHAEGDPRNDAIFQRLYGLNRGTQPNNPQLIEASIVLNVLKGYSGPGVITIGGCDYHNNNAQLSDAKDLEIGTSIGRALRAAHELKTPLFIQIITDGSVYAKESDEYLRAWQGDSNQHSMTVLGYYDPKKKPELIHQQVGAYTAQGVVDQTTSIGAGPTNMVLATVANYLKVNNMLESFETITGRRINTINPDQTLVFA